METLKKIPDIWHWHDFTKVLESPEDVRHGVLPAVVDRAKQTLMRFPRDNRLT
jgi:hypothetical protein